MPSAPKTVAGLVALQPPDRRKALHTLRQLIKRSLPKVKESLHLGAIEYRIDGDLYCALIPHKSFVSMQFSDSVLVERYASAMGELGHTKNSVRFRRNDEIPADLLEAMLIDAAALIPIA